jgi:hypothetical protein
MKILDITYLKKTVLNFNKKTFAKYVVKLLSNRMYSSHIVFVNKTSEYKYA